MFIVFESLKYGLQQLFSSKILIFLLFIPFIATAVSLSICISAWQPIMDFVLELSIEQGLSETVASLCKVFSQIAVVFACFVLIYFFSTTITALWFLPSMSKKIHQEYYSHLPTKQSFEIKSLFQSYWHIVKYSSIYIVILILCLPLFFIPGLSIVVHIFLTAWYNQNLFLNEALVDFASENEITKIQAEAKYDCLAMSSLFSLLSIIPILNLICPLWSLSTHIYYAMNRLDQLKGQATNMISTKL